MEGTKFTDAELVAMAPNLMKEIASLQSEIDRLKEENKALIEALITCSKKDDKYSYIVARCTLKNYNHPH